MSIKSVIQIIILLIIFAIIGGVYLKYFSNEKILVNQNPLEVEKKDTKNPTAEKKLNQNEEKEKKLRNPTINDIQSLEEKEKLKKNNFKENNSQKIEGSDENKISNLVKDVEYLTTDKNGNKYKILATSGKTNKEDPNILDLENVRGQITSENRSTIYIFSDFAEYNSLNLESKFQKNVVIKYEDKQIICENFDINMETNIAIAYNNVVLTDPKSTMKAGKIALDIETKEIEINPDQNGKNKVIISTEK